MRLMDLVKIKARLYVDVINVLIERWKCMMSDGRQLFLDVKKLKMMMMRIKSTTNRFHQVILILLPFPVDGADDDEY
jgi:hypothetical protein